MRRKSLENALRIVNVEPIKLFIRCTHVNSIASGDVRSPAKSPRESKRVPDMFAAPPRPSSFPPYNGQEQFAFEIIHTSKKSRARVGRIHTQHGIVNTPGFVAVATNGALKSVEFSQADDAGLELAFCNTYHLMLHPGAGSIEEAGGLHAFTGRRQDRPLITDSGGFQVFSLAYGTVHQELTSSLKRRSNYGVSHLREGNLVLGVHEEGVVFKSYRDGSRMLLSPETSVAAQKSLGADIILPLDELPPYHISEGDLEASVARSHRWEARSLRAHIENPGNQAMYGIVHGGSDLKLRQASAEYIGSLPFEGVAVGGALGFDHAELNSIMHHVMNFIPRNKPCHVLGIADPKSVPDLVELGCDTFDSCYPTRVGRHGAMLIRSGNLRVASGAFKSAHRTPVEGCKCPTCTRYTLSYLHHLVKAREPVAASLLTLHNIFFMCSLMAELRAKIMEDAI